MGKHQYHDGGCLDLRTRIAAGISKPNGEDGCWVWTKRTSARGYAYITHKGKQTRVHRAMYEMHKGPIPDGLTIDHLCFNKACVNPAHLDACSTSENTKRYYATITHCEHGHPFDEANTRMSGSSRICKTCSREHVKRRYHADKERGRLIHKEYRERRKAQIAAGETSPRRILSRPPTCKNGHAFSAENTQFDPQGRRVCRTCRRDSAMRIYHANREKQQQRSREYRARRTATRKALKLSAAALAGRE